MTDGERYFIEIETHEAFVRDHEHDYYPAWVKWAERQPGQIRQMYRRISDNTATAETRSRPGAPITVQQLDPSIPGMDELSYSLRMMVHEALRIWDREERVAPD